MDPRDASASKKHLGIGDKKVLENTEWRVFGGAALCTVPPRQFYKYKRIVYFAAIKYYKSLPIWRKPFSKLNFLHILFFSIFIFFTTTTFII